MYIVTVKFVYDEVKGKDENYYRDKAFDEIYNSDDVIDSSNFKVKKI